MISSSSPHPLLSSVNQKRLIFILGCISMLMPLSIDLYLPSFTEIAHTYGTTDGMVSLTIGSYLAGFGLGQLVYGPISDSFGRKPIIIFGLLAFMAATIGCAYAPTIDALIGMRFVHGFAAASCVVVINALLRDLFDKEDFSRTLSFVTLVSNVAPLLAPIIGGWIIIWYPWQVMFGVLAACALVVLGLVAAYIPETLRKEYRVPFSLAKTFGHFIALFGHKKMLCYMLAGAFSSMGLFSFLSFGTVVYIKLYGVSVQNFGYFFAFNIVTMMSLTTMNTRLVHRLGTMNMLKLGLSIQGTMGVLMLLVTVFDLGFIPLVLCVAGYIGCVSMIGSNLMATTLSQFPHMSGTVSSLAGTLRFFISSVAVMLLSMFLQNQQAREAALGVVDSHSPQWVMVGAMSASVFLAILFLWVGAKAADKDIA
ncbi:Bcr/CflA family multidrug efflux MFS transporter [Neisseriaceae bacterium CLB008]